jgi:hypothetical protein
LQGCKEKFQDQQVEQLSLRLKAAAWLAILPLVFVAGCARQLVPQITGERSPAGQQLPFERTADTRGISPTAEFMPGLVPVGTAITVRLVSPLSSAVARAGDSFDAVLDEPLIVQGQILAPQGATITGKVLDARASGQMKDPGYMRLVLTALLLNGKFKSLQTTSVFAKGRPRWQKVPAAQRPSISSATKGNTVVPSEQQDVRYDTDQRLTFRLTEPLPVRG